MAPRKAATRRRAARRKAARGQNKAFVHYSVHHAVEHFRSLSRG